MLCFNVINSILLAAQPQNWSDLGSIPHHQPGIYSPFLMNWSRTLTYSIILFDNRIKNYKTLLIYYYTIFFWTTSSLNLTNTTRERRKLEKQNITGDIIFLTNGESLNISSLKSLLNQFSHLGGVREELKKKRISYCTRGWIVYHSTIL